MLGDALVDLDQNLKPVWVWDSFDHLCSSASPSPCLDVNRHPMNSPDWMHSNALVYSQDDGNLALSIRNQCWVIKIAYENGQGAGDILSPVYSFWGGSAQQLPDNNVIFCITTPSDDLMGARYMEVTDDPTSQVVLQMEVTGQNAYRAVHLPSLYPGVQW